MPSLHLGDEPLRYGGEIEGASLFREDRMKQHLEQYVAQLLAHQPVVFKPDRVVELGCFLDQIGSKRFVRLRGVPFAPFSEVSHEGERVVQ